MLYANVSISRGFRSGGSTAAAAPYDPGTLRAYEAELESDLFDRGLTANVAVFWNDYSELKLPSFLADPGEVGGFGALVTNAWAATIRGVEVGRAAPGRPRLTSDLGDGR